MTSGGRGLIIRMSPACGWSPCCIVNPHLTTLLAADAGKRRSRRPSSADIFVAIEVAGQTFCLDDIVGRLFAFNIGPQVIHFTAAPHTFLLSALINLSPIYCRSTFSLSPLIDKIRLDQSLGLGMRS